MSESRSLVLEYLEGRDDIPEPTLSSLRALARQDVAPPAAPLDVDDRDSMRRASGSCSIAILPPVSGHRRGATSMSEVQIREMFRLLDQPTQSDRDRWATPRLVAEIWCCDDEFDGLCYQPQIDRVEPNRKAGFPWVHRSEVWRGTFVNEPTVEEYDRLTTELREGAALHGIELVEREGFWPHGTKSLAGSQEGSE